MFNVSISYELIGTVDFMRVECKREARMSKAREFFLREPILEQCPTKRLIFGISGLVSFDPARAHSASRMIGDLLRSIFGRCFHDIDWSTPCDLRSLTTETQAAYCGIVRWARDICAQGSSGCVHLSPVHAQSSAVVKLEVSCDASLYGGSVVIEVVHSSMDTKSPSAGRYRILEDAFRFTAAQVCHSSNRRELRMCLEALRRTSDLLLYHRATAADFDPPIEVVLMCDNKSSTSWIQSMSGELRLNSSRGVERRCVARLINAIYHEVQLIREVALSFRVVHVAGSANGPADSISRYLDRMVPVEGSTSSSLGQLLLPPRKAGRIEIDHVVEDEKDMAEAERCCSCGERWFFEDGDRVIPFDQSDVCCLLRDSPIGGFVDDEINLSREDPVMDMEVLSNFDIGDSGAEATVRTIDAIFSVREGLYTERNTDPPREPRSEAVVETVSRWSYDLDAVLHTINIVRGVIEVLKQNARGAEAGTIGYDFHRHWDEPAIFAAAHSAQYGLSLVECPPPAIPTANPLQIYGPEGAPPVVCYRSGLPSGECILQPVIPKAAVFFRDKIVSSAHRETLHSGLVMTCSSVRVYHLDAVTALAKNIINRCLACRILQSARSWKFPLGFGSELPEEIFSCGPYGYSTMDVLSLGEHVHVLTIQCRSTRHIVWKHLEATTMAEILVGIKRAQRTVGSMRVLYADSASYFKSGVFQAAVLSEAHCEVRLLDRYAPWSGSHERHHRTCLDYLRHLLRHDNGRIAKLSAMERQDLYDEITLVHNNLPLGTFILSGATEIPVTADFLALGHSRLDVVAACARIRTVTPWLPFSTYRKVRNTYLSHMWSAVKKRNTKVSPISKDRGEADYSLDKGAPVLVYAGSRRKLSCPFTLAHIESRLSTNRVRVRLPHGVYSNENIRNIVLLHRDRGDFTECRRPGPSLLGMPVFVKVPIVSDDETGFQWFTARIIDWIGQDDVLLRWDTGEQEWVTLFEEDWLVNHGQPCPPDEGLN